MPYRLRDEETLPAGLRRIACEQVQAAIAASKEDENGETSPVHQTRKHLKKARAVLHLLRGEVPAPLLRREERRLRKVGRLISDIRDAEVRLGTVRQLRDRAQDKTDRNFGETEELLAFELDSFLAAFAGWQDEAAAKLIRVRDTVDQWPLAGLTRAHVCANVKISYRRGRKALKRTKKNGEVKDFHELRKRTKELWCQMRIVRPLHPEVFGELANELKKIGEHLGHAHDMAFVGERLNTLAGATGRRRGQRALEALIDSRRQDLQHGALALSEHFFARKPKLFAARLAEHFEDWERAKLRRSAEIFAIVA